MTLRERKVLHSIVEAYIETGEPQGSRGISRALQAERAGGALSPATIRNIMADLTDAGYLSQPHASAGRVPTLSAFQDYASTLRTRPTHSPASDRFVAELNPIDSIEGRVEHACRILKEISRAMGIAASVLEVGRRLDHIELIGLADRRVLIIVVSRDRHVNSRVVSMEEDVSGEELAAVRNYINWQFAGWSLEDVRREIERRVEEERAQYDAILRRLSVLFRSGLLEDGKPPHIHLDGASNLVGLDLHLTRERMRDLFRALEEKQRVAELLDRFLDPKGVGIQIGLGDAHPAMRELSLVGVTAHMPGGVITRIAVLGPLKMDYARVMRAVAGIGQAFERVRAC